MRYFASVDHSDAKLSEVEEQVMATNPVMEVFGNPKNHQEQQGKQSKITGASKRSGQQREVSCGLLGWRGIIFIIFSCGLLGWQYNVSQIEQWTVNNGFSEAGIHMLMTSQAAKLLQIKMFEKADIDLVLDFCFLLNPTQIYKLLSMYRDDETEKGIPVALLEYVSKKGLKANEELAINAQGHAPFSAPAPRVIPAISNFLPKDISLTVLSYIQAK